MYQFKNLVGEEVKVEISGQTTFSGLLIDIGLDILVLYNGKNYLFIPFMHMHNLKKWNKSDDRAPTEKPDESWSYEDEKESISYRKILKNAKGQFMEIFVTGNKSIHGYITNVLNDYICFYSPVYKTIFISMQHVKWLTPYNSDITPYTLSKTLLPVIPASVPLARTFEEQIKKYEGQLLVFDTGDHPDKVGLLLNISNNVVELVNATGHPVYWKLSHLKSVHLP
ncbi:DUF2642 domain-containing protein [Bacillus sp. V5-8f]|uniref:DUF2642 domain-containing protein n=1 Tax=Bacillus sp. V5-8f TaxID=2053044 RepID=UPI000C77E406|nr:DUF2642 domain-containing protein [Bacillus sp. V5-8f]PLT35303.1 DUF2642 domain-containing protein [Bacillus sp. V5-8f]